MSTPFHLLLPAQFYEAMVAQAQAELPNECCGLLAGTVGTDGVARALQHYPLPNAAASPVEFESDGRAMFDAERDMRARGLDVLAVYHSHPTSAALPSRKDRERNYLGEVVHFIVGLNGKEPDTRGWWLNADTHAEAAWEIIG